MFKKKRKVLALYLSCFYLKFNLCQKSILCLRRKEKFWHIFKYIVNTTKPIEKVTQVTLNDFLTTLKNQILFFTFKFWGLFEIFTFLL